MSSEIAKSIVDQIEQGQFEAARGSIGDGLKQSAADAVDMKRVNAQVDWMDNPTKEPTGEQLVKSFNVLSNELNEAKLKLPTGSKELKSDSVRIGSKKVMVSYAQNRKNRVDVYMDGNLFSGDNSYKDLKAAEKEMKDIKKIMSTMSEEGITVEEIINEINI